MTKTKIKKSVKSRLILLGSMVVVLGLGWFLFKPVFTRQQIRNVILISIDTCRADHLSCYGCPVETTPNIDAVAAEGILFENVIAPVPITLPSHSSMLTGTIPPYHGVHDNYEYTLNKSNITLAEILHQNGFTTGAIVSSVTLDSQFGIDQGFDSYNDHFEEMYIRAAKAPIDDQERVGEETNHFAFEWLEKNKDKKAFLFLHYFDPHKSYTPPEPFASRFARNPYAGEVAYTDYCIGQVIEKLKELDIYDSSLIIITADHGEMLGEHGESTHSYFIYQSAIKVPLIVKLPGQNKPATIEKIAGLIDIVPTVCNLLKIPVPAAVQGKDLSPFFGGSRIENEDRYLYSESLYPTQYKANPLLAVVTDRWKYIQTTRPELYDLRLDKKEINNLVTEKPQQARILQDKLKQILEQTVRENVSDRDADMDEKTMQRLESLGYVSAGGIKEDFEFNQNAEDAKDMIGFHGLFSGISPLIRQKKYAQAMEICRELLSQRPEVAALQIKMAEIALKMENPEEAVSHLEKALSLDGREYQIYKGLGMAMRMQDKNEQAIEYYIKSLLLRPQQSDVLDYLAGLYFDQGDISKAAEQWKKAIEVDPDYAKAYRGLANALQKQGKNNEAVENYRRALRLTEKPSIKAQNNLAWLLATQREAILIDPDEAIDLAENVCQQSGYQNPGFLDTLAVCYASAGRFAEAVSTAEKALELAKPLNNKALTEEIDSHLQLFKASRRYIEP